MISVARSPIRAGNTTYRQHSSRHMSTGTSVVISQARLRHCELRRRAASVRTVGSLRSSHGSE